MNHIAEAIAKINTEMQKKPNDKYLEAIGHHVIDSCTSEENALAVLEDKKTLAGAMTTVTGKAKKLASGNVAVMEECEVYELVDKYFGLTDAPAAPAAPAVAPKPGILLDFNSFI